MHYFSTIPVGRIKIVTVYKRSIFQVEWLVATLILCISHCSESDSLSSRVFYSAVSTAPRFLFSLVLSVTRRRLPLGQVVVETSNHATCNAYLSKAFKAPIHENFTDIFSSLCIKYVFFGLIKVLDSKQRTCQNVQGLRHSRGQRNS